MRESIQGAYVYFIRECESGYVKIGWSGQPSHRLRELQTGNPRPLTLLRMHQVADGPLYEKLLHEHFARYRIRDTEWFLLSEDAILGLQVDEVLRPVASIEQGLLFTREAFSCDLMP